MSQTKAIACFRVYGLKPQTSRWPFRPRSGVAQVARREAPTRYSGGDVETVAGNTLSPATYPPADQVLGSFPWHTPATWPLRCRDCGRFIVCSNPLIAICKSMLVPVKTVASGGLDAHESQPAVVPGRQK
jgi:hypothetical protein